VRGRHPLSILNAFLVCYGMRELVNRPNIALHPTCASKLFHVFEFCGGRGRMSFGVIFKDSLGSRPDSPENRLFLAILPTKLKIGARIVKSWIESRTDCLESSATNNLSESPPATHFFPSTVFSNPCNLLLDWSKHRRTTAHRNRLIRSSHPVGSVLRAALCSGRWPC